MRLTLHSDYAMRMLMMLAARGDVVAVDEIAQAYGISRHHLMKVAGRLAELGYIISRRGRGGGLTLAREPVDINVGAVIRDIESLDSFVECFDKATNQCVVAGACGLQSALSLAVGDFLARLDSFTLADLAPDTHDFVRRLASPANHATCGG